MDILEANFPNFAPPPPGAAVPQQCYEVVKYDRATGEWDKVGKDGVQEGMMSIKQSVVMLC